MDIFETLANSLLREMWNREDYTDFAVSVQGDSFKIDDDDICELKKIERALQTEAISLPGVIKELGKRMNRIIECMRENKI